MGMNIKNPEAQLLARELAELTGESLTGAVIEALRERVERVRHERKKQSLAERWDGITKHSTRLWKKPYKSADHGDLLYDERGLPK